MSKLVPTQPDRRVSFLRSRSAAISMAMMLAGCASYGPGGLAPGASIDQIIAKMGRPTGDYKMPDGTRRLEYARGPTGVRTYMLDLDAAGGLKSSQQVLTENRFEAVRAGMTQDELLRTLGHPAEIRGSDWQKLAFWNYRYENPFCTFFQVDVDRSGIVRGTGHGPDPVCTPFMQ
jgi:hypothetical protein